MFTCVCISKHLCIIFLLTECDTIFGCEWFTRFGCGHLKQAPARKVLDRVRTMPATAAAAAAIGLPHKHTHQRVFVEKCLRSWGLHRQSLHDMYSTVWMSYTSDAKQMIWRSSISEPGSNRVYGQDVSLEDSMRAEDVDEAAWEGGCWVANTITRDTDEWRMSDADCRHPAQHWYKGKQVVCFVVSKCRPVVKVSTGQ